MITVRLSWAELTAAAHAGVLARVAAICRQQSPAAGLDPRDPGWNCSISGAIAEFVVAKALDRFAKIGAAPDYTGDTYRGHEVRGTPLPDGCLILRPGDRAAAPYVLVTGAPPEFQIRGWLYGHEGKQDRYRRNGGDRAPAFFIPIGDLHPIETLPPEVNTYGER
jgi:hypothetical protein